MFQKLILPLWILASISLFAYSFTQVHLSLTLSQVSVWQGIQKGFQYVGYFDRPLSTVIFLIIISVLFLLYGLTLRLIQKNIIDKKLLIKIILSVSVILLVSYNAFSNDIFNYIFDAKIFTYYNENPYEHKALDYPEDPMLSFMHWTHRTYPYGPVWLAVSIPLSYLGLGYFLVTFYLFKLIAFASFILSLFIIGKISEKMGKNPLLPMAAFALNPLVLIEALVSAHNDIVMIALALAGVLFYLERRLIKSFLFLLASILLKYATVLVIPAIMLRGLFGISINTFFYVLILSMVAAVVLASMRTNFQPWYLLYVIPFAAFVANRYFVVIPLFLITAAGLLTYAPHLYTGNWNPPIPQIIDYIMFASIAISLGVMSVLYFLKSKNKQ